MIKFLKRLCTLLLIGLPILLVNFSSAGYTYKIGDGSAGDYITSPYNSNYKFQTIQNGGFSSSFGGSYKLLMYPGDFNNFNGFLFRDYNGLPYFYVSSQGNGRTNQNMITGHFNQGEITKYYLCNELSSGDTSISNCNEYTVGEGFYDFIVSYLSGVNIDDYYYIDFAGLHNDWYDLVNLTYCISSNLIGNSICFKASSCFNRSPSLPNCEIYSFPSELNSLYDYFTLAEDFTTVPNSILNFPPDGNSINNSIPSYEFNEDDDYTNGQIIQGFNAMGLTDEFCYGGYQINDIFANGENPDDFIGYRWGGGASIFDLWNVYKDDFSGDYISFLRTFYIAYDTNNLAQFYGYSKAVFGWVNQWFSVSSKGLGFLESTAPMFTLKDVWDYCDLRFYGDPNATYTGNNWNAKYRYYTSGQVNLGGYFSFSGNNSYFSGTLSGFDEPDDFFGSLNAIFQGGLQDIVSDKVGVLPDYIILFLFAIILIRILSH